MQALAHTGNPDEPGQDAERNAAATQPERTLREGNHPDSMVGVRRTRREMNIAFSHMYGIE